MRDYKYGDLYFDTQHDKQIKIDVVGTGIVIDNSMIEMEAFELDETLCSESELKFGRCEANCVKFTARNLPGSINGKTINVTETIDGNTDEPFSYGKYKVYSDVPTSDRTKREITAYDAMYDIINADVKQWYAWLSFPMTLRKFRDSFFTYLGITQKETTLVNDGMTVNKTLVATKESPDSSVMEDSISGKTIVEAICEINGAFGNINRDGDFEYVILKPIISGLYPANDLYPRNDLFPRNSNTVSMSGHYITFDYEDFKSRAITQMEIRPADGSAGTVVGKSGNNYAITGNFLVSDKNEDELRSIAENTLSVIKDAAYTPIKSSSCVGNPCLELGDPIRFNTSREIIETYILQRTLTGVQSKKDSFVSNGTETHSSNVNSIREEIKNISGRTNKLERTAEHTLSELEDMEKDISTKFEQSARKISLTATGGDQTVGIEIEILDEKDNVISSAKEENIKITGAVKFEDLEKAGSTKINGSNITTGTINCDLLDGGKIKGQTIVGAEINGSTILSQRYNETIYGDVYYGSFLKLENGVLSGGFDETEYGNILFSGQFYEDATPWIKSPGLIIDSDYIALKPGLHLSVYEGQNADGSDHYLFGGTGNIPVVNDIDLSWTTYESIKSLSDASWNVYDSVTVVTDVDFNNKTVSKTTLSNLICNLSMTTSTYTDVVCGLSVDISSGEYSYLHGLMVSGIE